MNFEIPYSSVLLITLFKAIQSWNGSSEETNHNLYEGGLKQWAMCPVVDPYIVITPQLITSLDKD